MSTLLHGGRGLWVAVAIIIGPSAACTSDTVQGSSTLGPGDLTSGPSGTGGAAGAAGAGGIGGQGGGSPSCPATAPANDSDCATVDQCCPYRQTGCLCIKVGTTMNAWQCSTTQDCADAG